MSFHLAPFRRPLCRPAGLRGLPLSTAVTHPPRRRFLTLASVLSLGTVAGFGLALVAPRPQLLSILFPKPTPVHPSASSEEGLAHAAEVEEGLQALPLVSYYRSLLIPAPLPPTSPTSSLVPPPDTTPLVPAYTESRPYSNPPGPHSLSAYTLRGPGKFSVPPLVFTSLDRKEAVFFLHLGSAMCGHEGIIHGGLLATILDESMGLVSFYSLPNHIGVTATLSVAYKKPTFANQYVVVHAKTVEAKGRRVTVKATIENLAGETLVEAEGLFVEPKMAKWLSNSTAKELIK